MKKLFLVAAVSAATAAFAVHSAFGLPRGHVAIPVNHLAPAPAPADPVPQTEAAHVALPAVAAARIAPVEAVAMRIAPSRPGAGPRKDRGFAAVIRRYAAKNGVPFALAQAVVQVESNFRPNARGRAGEVGLMQIKPATARLMGFRGSVKQLYDPETNIRYGMRYLGKAYRLGGGATCRTILKYNAGHGAKRMNRISAAYCRKVERMLRGR